MKHYLFLLAVWFQLFKKKFFLILISQNGFPICFPIGFYFVGFGCAGSSLLCGLFSGCSEWGRLSGCRAQALTAVASLAVDAGSECVGFSSCITWAQQLRLPGSRAQCCGAQAWLLPGTWDLPWSGIKHHLLHQQADSLPLSHQGSPHWMFNTSKHNEHI